MTHRCLRFVVVVLGICGLGCASEALAQRSSAQGEMGWVGLFNAAFMEWVEDPLKGLCSHAAVDTPKWRECRDRELKPREYLIQLRSAPRETAPSEGVVVIRATLDAPIRVYYRPARGGQETQFVPDLFDQDWGYGPYFHQTFLERRGTWFLLPAVPLPRPAWANISEPHVRLVVDLRETRDVAKTPWGDLIVLGMDSGVLRARPAQPADMWCQGGDPPPLKPWKEIRIPVEKLYSSTGHLLMDIKFKRGC